MHADPHSPFVARASRGVLTARIAVLVDASGRVLDAHVASRSGLEHEHLLLDSALLAALRRFHFRPATGNGGPERGWSTVECALRLGPRLSAAADAANEARMVGPGHAREP